MSRDHSPRRSTRGAPAGLATAASFLVRTMVVVTASVFLLTGFTYHSGSPRAGSRRPVVTPAQAKAAVTAWNQLADTAASNLDANMLDQLEAPPLLGVDVPGFQDAKARGASPPPVVGVANVSVYVPKQTSYPAQFLARLDGANGATDFVVLVKASKQAPWKAAYRANLVANATAPDLALDRRGYAAVITERQAKKQLKFDPATLGRAYSDFLNQSAQGSAPAPSATFSPDVAQPLLSSLSPVSAGQRAVTYASANDPVYSYRTRDGGAFSLVGATVEIRTTADAGAVFTPPQQLFDLRPGQRYQSTEMKGIDLVGLTVPPARAAALVVSRADFNAVISATGVPA